MPKAEWPPAEKRTLIGKPIDRADGPAKATGTAKYSYDINRPNMLWAKVVTSPHPHAEVAGIDTSAAEKLEGVKGVWKDEAAKEVNYVGQIVAAVAATTEEIATEAVSLVKVNYNPLEHQVVDSDPELFKGDPNKRDQGNVDEAFGKADVTHSGNYGVPVITHCCLEPHGQVAEIRDGEMYVWPSTQNVSGYADRGLSEAAGIPQNKIHVDCQYMGGGFGSKFNPGKWGTISAALAKQTGRPVKLLLDRDLELMIAGNRPSGFSKIKVGATKDGKVTAFESEVWGTSGMSGNPPDLMPYVFDKIPNQRRIVKRIQTNRGPAQAWRAPRHPQNCYLTLAALADTAAALKMDELEFFTKNLDLTARPDVYKEELEIAARLVNYNQKKHVRGDKTPGPIKRGLGISVHTWGGLGHDSECDVTVSPDGSVEAKIGTQDLGTGTRTVIQQVVADTLGLPLDAVKVQIGKNEFPRSGGSGGSTTIGGVSTSSRLAATAALNAVCEAVAQKLGTTAENLEAAGGAIRQVDKPSNRISWKDACAALGVMPITKRGTQTRNEGKAKGFTNEGVGGVQIADVSVDIETGVVTLNEMVAVQDCGLIVNLKLTESQVYGALIMGITYALYEEAVYDPKTGRMLNADMEFYRLAGIKDIGLLKVHMMTGKGYDDRGVIGIGEPPVISPGAAIGNAVANAIGVRVPSLPLTPDRIITALQKEGSIV
ncbi:MAG: xanthine dehydrogenase family protein molybdopterin-binding subunit [Verrucomicrobia subdivision 3 bacterium]|nr:xanthine dehydrogenase family protein molybdopterin-binding subunit [Limisphaerales bacterium]